MAIEDRIEGPESEPADAPVTRLSTTARVEAFSDGVMAVAITLLVLDLKVPTDDQVTAAGGLISALLLRWPSYLAYLAAFLTIGIIWLNHRSFVDKVRTFDNQMQWLNLGLLLGVATLPFATALLAEYLNKGGAEAREAAVIYGLLSFLTALPWGLMWRHLMRHPELLEPEFGAAYAQAERGRASIGPVVYGLAVPLAYFFPIAAILLYVALAVLYALTNQGVARR